jgi:xylose dehydrogenase (NAD/NADP)
VTVHVGLLSTARINRKILAGAAGTDEVDVVAVASRDGERARAYAAEHGLARPHGSYEELLADPGVDAVYISLPNSLHVEWSIRALEAGKHVLCEKPLTRRPDEAERAFDAADRAGRLLMEAFMWRHHPQTKQLAELVADGSIGELRLVRSAFTFPLTELANIRLQRALEGGSLMDVGCYCVSAARLLAGEPERFGALQTLAPSGVDVRFAGALQHAGGVLAHFDCALDLPDLSRLEVVGSEGSIVVSDPWHGRRAGLEVRLGEMVERIAIEPTDPYTCQFENFAGAIAGRAEPLLGRADAVGQARALASLYAAADAGPLAV